MFAPFPVSIVNNAVYIINNLFAKFGDKFWFSTQTRLDYGTFKDANQLSYQNRLSETTPLGVLLPSGQLRAPLISGLTAHTVTQVSLYMRTKAAIFKLWNQALAVPWLQDRSWRLRGVVLAINTCWGIHGITSGLHIVTSLGHSEINVTCHLLCLRKTTSKLVVIHVIMASL